MAGMQTQKPSGCYKCGQQGHWARDCTVPSTEWTQSYKNDMTRRREAQAGAKGGKRGGAETQRAERPNLQQVHASRPQPSGQDNATQREAAGDGSPSSAPAFKQPKKIRRTMREPLTVAELCVKETGFEFLLGTVAKEFPATIKGPGHEGRDLRRLLRYYQKWHAEFCPRMSFDTFVAELASLSRSRGDMHDRLYEMRRECVRSTPVEALVRYRQHLAQVAAQTVLEGDGGAPPGAAGGNLAPSTPKEEPGAGREANGAIAGPRDLDEDDWEALEAAEAAARGYGAGGATQDPAERPATSGGDGQHDDLASSPGAVGVATQAGTQHDGPVELDLERMAQVLEDSDDGF